MIKMRKKLEKHEHLVCFHFSIVPHRKSKKHYGGYLPIKLQRMTCSIYYCSIVQYIKASEQW